MDIWEKLESNKLLGPEEKKKACNELLTREDQMEALILRYFTEADYREVYQKRIGEGLIGGKACGVLLARKLIAERLSEYVPDLLPHHSWFIGSGVFCRYLRENRCLELIEQQRREKEKFGNAELLRERLKNGTFSEEIEDALLKMLHYYGSSPIIVRSSSILEDGFKKAFSGKYESVFCINQGTMKERMDALKDAIRRVYTSTMNPAALEYRRKWNLLDVDEQMALLVQRVEGECHGAYYFPAAAGMGCSYNPYKWMEEMNPDAGMLRLVVGLGTRAVERTPGDYPRLVCLDHAQGNIHTTIAERHKYCQRQMDILDLEEGILKSQMIEKLTSFLSEKQKDLILSRDTDAEAMLYQQKKFQKVFFADCEGLTGQKQFIRMMRRILKMLEAEYGYPVDIEFALRINEEGKILLNLFQCRPLRPERSERIQITEGRDEMILFDVRRTSMRRSKAEHLDIAVLVDPQKYYEFPYVRKPDIGRTIGQINQYYKTQDKKMLLLVPGRIGTSSPELGVTVTYAEISQFSAICEVAYSKAGYKPDLSYGSHMFQDLVEADVYYGAINENSKTRLYQPKLLERFPNIFSMLFSDKKEMEEIVKVYDLSDANVRLMLDAKEGRAVCQIGMPDPL